MRGRRAGAHLRPDEEACPANGAPARCRIAVCHARYCSCASQYLVAKIAEINAQSMLLLARNKTICIERAGRQPRHRMVAREITPLEIDVGA